MNIQDINLKFDSEKLGLYQLRQHEHDKLYHSDIVALGLVRRLVHVALHLAKYAYGISLPRNNERFKKNYTDAFVMIISAANILNIDLSECQNKETFPNDCFLSNYLYFVSVFSKSCESYDHFEEHNFHETWRSSIVSLFNLFERDSLDSGVDLIRCAHNRLNEVNNKYMQTNIETRLKSKLRIVK